MRSPWRWLSLLGFLLAGAAFLLPFVTRQLPSTSDTQVDATWRGVELVVGGTAQLAATRQGAALGDADAYQAAEQLLGGSQQAQDALLLPGQAGSLGALVLITFGLIAGLFFGARKGYLWMCVSGVMGALLLAIAEFNAVSRLGLGFTDTAWGFWAGLSVLLVLFLGTGVGAYLADREPHHVDMPV